MSAWWNALTSLQQIFYAIAIPATVLLLIQTALLLFGLGDHGSDAGGGGDHDLDHGFDHVEMDHAGFDHVGADSDFVPEHAFDHGLDHGFAPEHAGPVDSGVSHADAADLRLFTLRGVIAFFVMTGWTGVMFATVMPVVPVVLLALAMGFAGLYLTAKLFQWSRRLQQSGNIRWEGAVGQAAQVYIPVPAARRGTGKVMVLLQERLLEKEAATDARQTLATGLQVRVRAVLPDGRLLVEPLRGDVASRRPPSDDPEEG
jgi:hypothetical protein